MKTVVLLLVAGCAVASLAETPKVPAAPPVIPDALQKNFFKAQTHFIQANAEMQTAVDAMNQACGEYALQMNPAGDPVCIPRPKIEKPAETPKPKK